MARVPIVNPAMNIVVFGAKLERFENSKDLAFKAMSLFKTRFEKDVSMASEFDKNFIYPFLTKISKQHRNSPSNYGGIHDYPSYSNEYENILGVLNAIEGFAKKGHLDRDDAFEKVIPQFKKYDSEISKFKTAINIGNLSGIKEASEEANRDLALLQKRFKNVRKENKRYLEEMKAVFGDHVEKVGDLFNDDIKSINKWFDREHKKLREGLEERDKKYTALVKKFRELDSKFSIFKDGFGTNADVVSKLKEHKVAEFVDDAIKFLNEIMKESPIMGQSFGGRNTQSALEELERYKEKLSHMVLYSFPGQNKDFQEEVKRMDFSTLRFHFQYNLGGGESPGVFRGQLDQLDEKKKNVEKYIENRAKEWGTVKNEAEGIVNYLKQEIKRLKKLEVKL